MIDIQHTLSKVKIYQERKKARKFVEKYSWDNIIDEFEGILKEVAQDG